MAFNAFGPRNALVEADAHRVGDLSARVNARCAREALSEDGFGARIWAAADRGDLTHAQAPLVVRSPLTAGVDTTVHGLAATLYAFATHPQEWQRLRARPELARVAFDEAVRWQSPVQTFFRTATTDVDVAGTRIREGGKILMFLGSAHRDRSAGRTPTASTSPATPRATSASAWASTSASASTSHVWKPKPLLTALARRIGHLELAGEPRRHLNNTLRSWASLPVRIRPAS